MGGKIYIGNSGDSISIGNSISIEGSSGIITATKFVGDGSQLSGVSGGVNPTENTTNQVQFVPSLLVREQLQLPEFQRLSLSLIHQHREWVSELILQDQHLKLMLELLHLHLIFKVLVVLVLFSVTNSQSSGSIFSVNDISGIPSIDVGQ